MNRLQERMMQDILDVLKAADAPVSYFHLRKQLRSGPYGGTTRHRNSYTTAWIVEYLRLRGDISGNNTYVLT